MAENGEVADGRARQNRRVKVHEGQMDAFRKRLDALNKKAVAYGLEPITIQREETRHYHYVTEGLGSNSDKVLISLVPVDPRKPPESVVNIKELDIDFPIIKLGAWEVMAEVEEVELGKNMVFVGAGAGSDTELFQKITSVANRPICCEHCGVDRRRKTGFLLRDSDTDVYKEVGSTCVEDFTGIDPAKALFLAKMYTILDYGAECFEATSGRVLMDGVDPEYYLTLVAFVAEQSGYVSSAAARNSDTLIATYSEAFAFGQEMARGRVSMSRQVAYQEREAHCKEKARAVIAWCAALEPKDAFQISIKQLMDSPYLKNEPKYLALASAAYQAHEKMLHTNAVQQVTAALPPKESDYVGAVGEAMSTKLLIKAITGFDSTFGYVNIVIFADKEGNELKWKSGSMPGEFKQHIGEVMAGKFKIKSHTLYHPRDDRFPSVRQTEISHVKALAWHPVAALLEDLPAIAPQDDPALKMRKSEVSEMVGFLVRLDDDGERWPDLALVEASTLTERVAIFAQLALDSGEPDLAAQFMRHMDCVPEAYLHNQKAIEAAFSKAQAKLSAPAEVEAESSVKPVLQGDEGVCEFER